MKKRRLTVLFALALLFIVPSCGPRICTPSELMGPTQTFPGFWETVDSLTPTLAWDYPSSPYGYYYPGPYYYEATGCVPQKFRVTLQTGPFFGDELGGETVNGTTNYWNVPTALEPGKEYAWGVRGMSGGSFGPFAGYSYFFTGPTCATASLVAPTLLEPANGAVIADNWPSLIWDYPQDCSPEGYRVDLSTTADFSDTSLSGGTGNPSTRWGAGHPLEDCRTYYWKVAGINDTTLGPASETFSFRINMGGTCLEHWPDFHVLRPAICRFGPLLDYNIMTYLNQGDTHPAEGRNEDGTWVLLRLDPNRLCWTNMNNGELDDDVFRLPFVKPPDLNLPGPGPTEPPVDQCSIYVDYKTCNQNATCTWRVFGYQGVCVSK